MPDLDEVNARILEERRREISGDTPIVKDKETPKVENKKK